MHKMIHTKHTQEVTQLQQQLEAAQEETAALTVTCGRLEQELGSAQVRRRFVRVVHMCK